MNPRRLYCCALAEWEGAGAEHSRTCPERDLPDQSQQEQGPAY